MTRSIWGQVYVQQQISAEKVFPTPPNRQKSTKAGMRRSKTKEIKGAKLKLLAKGRWVDGSTRVSRLIERIEMRPFSRYALIDKVNLDLALLSPQGEVFLN